MAWYRAGGGGIPSSLKTDMNDVLNKKFGTSQDYPPTDWAPTVNLMGPLPEKPASGAIVTFPDGADAVPLKKCEVSLPASLDGYSSVDVEQTGANLFDGLYEEGTYNQTTGQKENSTTLNRNITPIRVAQNTQFCRYKADTSYYAMRVFYYDANMSFISSEVNGNVDNWVFTTPSNCYYLNFAYQKLGDISKVSINSPSTVTGYHEYSGDTHTANLGRTIYGGTADVVNGQGESKFAKGSKALFDFAVGATVGDYTAYTYSGYITESINNNNKQTAYIGTTQIPYTYQGIGANTTHFYIGTNGQINLYLPNDWNDFSHDVEAVAELATPETFTFDPVPIDSKLGNNTIWSEQGSAEVTYRADINLSLGGQ